MKELKSKIFEKLTTLITNALGLVAALAWNSAFQNFFKNYPQLQEHGPWIYAIIITIISVIIITYLSKLETSVKNKINAGDLSLFNIFPMILTCLLLFFIIRKFIENGERDNGKDEEISEN